ncbi:Speckle-type POZ protein [Araneus ventricosus]|uniref:Speckle-type POZ protein n=1 Tax=Araneus ventricosus TaxID=182803 RepID=A0A4Y2E6I2_ARAVE|nr:Speckle-type POZ protein [Araneus ventricosus]
MTDIQLPIRQRKQRLRNFIERKCLNIYWKIKNFSYCWKIIRSPDFSISGSKCCLELNPNDVECKIVCLDVQQQQQQFALPRISFLTCDGSQEESQSSKMFLRVPKDTIFGQRRSAFLPEDTLTVRCRFQTDHERGKILFRSRIGVNRKSFLWTFQKFSEKESDKKLSLENSDQYGHIQLTLKSVGGINSGDEQYYMEISRRGGESCYCVLKVSVLDVDGKALIYTNNECDFEKEEGEQFWRFPLVIRNRKLLACQNLLIMNDTLSLRCDFAVTQGIISEQTTLISYCNDVASLLEESDDISMCFREGIFSDSVTDLKTDLERSILDNATLCDVSLQVGPDLINAHKHVLSAKSPVFNDIFTKDTKNETDNIVVIEDLDADTVRRLLFYMYTDALHDYLWENIMNLFSAADKYNVLSLKQKCSFFLKANLSFSNVCQVLVLADMHQDADLKSAVFAFISKHNSEVFSSEAWRELEKNNTSLALQTLREICSNKR